jgi:hypothetical protein
MYLISPGSTALAVMLAASMACVQGPCWILMGGISTAWAVVIDDCMSFLDVAAAGVVCSKRLPLVVLLRQGMLAWAASWLEFGPASEATYVW